jgi:integrase
MWSRSWSRSGASCTWGPPKTRAGRRIVTLPRSVVKELAEHLGPVGEADAWVFTADKGGVLRPSNFRVKVWLPAVRAAGLAPLRPHDLRHTAVALWIAAGANPKEVSVRAGHTSVAFTLDRYGHLSPATMMSCATAWTPCTPRASRPSRWNGGAAARRPGAARRGPSAAHGKASKNKDSAEHRA